MPNNLIEMLLIGCGRPMVIAPDSPSKPGAAQLLQAAAELHAGLVVVGGFGDAPLREAVLGGVTQAIIEHSELPVSIVH